MSLNIFFGKNIDFDSSLTDTMTYVREKASERESEREIYI